MFQMASVLALLALNFLPMMGLDAKEVEKKSDSHIAERESPIKGPAAFALSDFEGNFIFISDSTGAVSNQSISQFGYGQSTGAVAQVSFDDAGNGTVNFMSFTAFSGALSTAYTTNAGADGYVATSCPPLPFPGSQNILPIPSGSGPDCGTIAPRPIKLTLVLTQPDFGAGYAVLKNMPTPKAVTYFDFVASKGGGSTVQTIFLNMSQTNIDVNNVIIQGNYSPYPFATIISKMIRQ